MKKILFALLGLGACIGAFFGIRYVINLIDERQENKNEPQGCVHVLVVDEAIPATCTSAGKTEGAHCEKCGEITTVQEDVPATGHKCTDWETVQAVTCKDNGVEEGVCEVCGQEIRKLIRPAPIYHVIEVDEAIPATCTTTGKSVGSHCKVCAEILIPQEIIPSTGHTWNNGERTKEPTCQTVGTMTCTCTVCGATKENAIPASLAYHVVEVDEAIPATCTTMGKTDGTHCAVCAEILIPQEIIPATGHIVGS